MPLINLALVVEARRIAPAEVQEVAAALQLQISRDFAPIWEVNATIDGFTSLDRVPPGYWVILVRDNLPMKGIVGIHLDEKGQPYALVRHTPSWTLAASHEALEMLADPFGSRLVPGSSPKPGQGLVEMLVEVCDPVGSPDLAYAVNGVLVSDFITPDYHDPAAVPGVRYSFSGAIQRPRDIAPGGYLSWRDPTTEEWWAWSWIGVREPVFIRIGLIDPAAGPLRESVNAMGELAFLEVGLAEDDPRLLAAADSYDRSRAASAANAATVNRSVRRLVGQRGGGSGGAPGVAGVMARMGPPGRRPGVAVRAFDAVATPVESVASPAAGPGGDEEREPREEREAGDEREGGDDGRAGDA